MFSRFGFRFLHFVVFLQGGSQQISEWVSLRHVLPPSFGVLGEVTPVAIWVFDNDRIPSLIFRADGFSHFSW